MTEESRPNAKTVVLVDDEQAVLFALKLLLGALGCTVVDFLKSELAVQYFAGNGPCDLVLCDLKMPGFDGIAVLEKLRQLRPTTPFVLMSGHASDNEVERARQQGSSAFIPKPFSGDDIRAVLSRL